MQIKFFCPFWGCEQLGYVEFLKLIKKSGYDGAEIILPYDDESKELIIVTARELGLEIISLWGGVIEGDFEQSLATYENHLRNACSIAPLFANVQSGKDHYSYSQNMEFLSVANQISLDTGIKVLHETHRGKFCFTAHITRKYLLRNPALRITADFSHWCAVSESLLEDQTESLELAISRTDHIHARVGFSQGPQIPDPRDPFWKAVFNSHLVWWDKIVALKKKEKAAFLTISPEFGPFPYMTILPNTGFPISSQWDINLYMKDFLKERYC